jgi:hypothetical protein
MSMLTFEEAALRGYELARKEAVDYFDQKIAELKAKIPEATGVTVHLYADPAKTKRKISAAHRKALSDAQKARWAKLSQPQETPQPKKRTMSAAGRKRVAAAQRARWAKIRAGRSNQPGPAQKAGSRIEHAKHSQKRAR